MPKKNLSGICKEHQNIISDILNEHKRNSKSSNISLSMLQNTIERSYNKYEKNKKILNNENVYFSDYFRLPDNRTGVGLLHFNQMINEGLQNNLINRLKNRVLKPHLHEYLKEPEVKQLFSNTENIKYTFDIIKRNLISQDKIQDVNTFTQVISNIIENHKNTNLQREAIEEEIRKHNEYYSDNISLEHLKDEKYLLRFTSLSYPFIQKNTPTQYCSNMNFEAYGKHIGTTVPSFIYYDFDKQDNKKRHFGYMDWSFEFRIYNEENTDIKGTECFSKIKSVILDNTKISLNFFIDSLKIFYNPQLNFIFNEEYFFLSELLTVSLAVNVKKEVARLNSEYNKIFTNNNDGMNYLFSKIDYMDLFISNSNPETLEYIINNLTIFKNTHFFQKFVSELIYKKYVENNNAYKYFFNLEYTINNFLIENYSSAMPLEKEDFLVLFLCKKDIVGEKLKNNLYFYLKDVYLKTLSTKEERLSAFSYVKRALPELVDDFILELYTNNKNHLSNYEYLFYITHSTKETQKKLLNKLTEEENKKLTSKSNVEQNLNLLIEDYDDFDTFMDDLDR